MSSWCAVVPQKAMDVAKTRLGLPDHHRRALAKAMLRDTVAAIRSTPGVDEVVVLWDDELDRKLLPDAVSLSVQARGLNLSLSTALSAVRRQLPGRGVVFVPSDLPALLPSELSLALARASEFDRAFQRDSYYSGTTILTAVANFPLLPAYGQGSAARHRATGAVPLSAAGVDSVRADVDDLASLAGALRLGCGHHTLGTCASLGLTPDVPWSRDCNSA